jgi:hypothetical protein
MPSGASFIFHGDDLFERNLPSALTQNAHSINGPLNTLPIDLNFGNKTGNTFSVTCDDDALPALHVVEDAKKNGSWLRMLELFA